MSYATGPVGTTSATGYTKPLPVIDTVTRGFWDLAKRRQLGAQACSKCGDIHFPASPVCPNCLSEDQVWQPVSGRGRLESWVEFHRAYWPGFAAELPYRVCLIKLDEGPLMVSNLVGDDAEVGDPVEVVFEDVTDEITLPKFRRVG